MNEIRNGERDEREKDKKEGKRQMNKKIIKG